MIKKTDFKVIGGKLIRIEADIRGEAVGQPGSQAVAVRQSVGQADSKPASKLVVIKSIKICGDFFVHPEEGIFKIEEALTGQVIQSDSKNLTQTIESAIKQNNLRIIGFSAKDLASAIMNLA